MGKGIRKLFFCFLFIFFLIPFSLKAEEAGILGRVLRFLEEIPNRNFTIEERPLLTYFGGFGSSVLVSSRISETEEPYGTFVFAVPLDAEFAVDTALAMAERLRANPVNILIAFLGEERNELPQDMGGFTHKGLRDLLTLINMPENWVLCYFDACPPPGALVVSHGFRGYVSPLELISPLPSLFTSYDIPWSFQIQQNTIYKLGLIEGPEALSIIWGEEVNGFFLTGENENGKPILPGDLANLLLEYAINLTFPVLNPEKHYSLISFPGGRVFFISERIMIIIVLATVGLLLLLYLFYSVRHNAILLFHLRLFRKYFAIFIILLSLLIISFKISGLLYSSLTSLFNLQAGAPNHIALVLTFILSLLVFYLSSHALVIIRFPLRERFFKLSTVVFIILGIFSAIFLDFSYILFFFIVFIFFFLGVLMPNPVLTFSFALFLPVFALITLSNIFLTDNERLTELFIIPTLNMSDSWVVIFQTALLSLPVFLLVKRGTMLTRILLRKKPKQKRQRRYIILPIMIVLVVITMLVNILLPRREISPERRFITQTLELENAEPGILSILTLSIEDVIFQDSRIITLNLTARGNPKRFDISIYSETERILLPMYSTPVPFEREYDGRRINLFLGERPPNPLVMEIVVPLEFQGRLETAALYNTWDPAIDPGEIPVSENYVLRVSKSVSL